MNNSPPLKTISSTRERLGTLFVFGVAIFAIVSALYHLHTIEYVRRAYQNGNWLNLSVYRYHDKLLCLEGDLASYQTVGFIAQLNHTQNIEYYQLAQYFLAPTLVDFSTEHPFVIGYAPNPGDLESILIANPELQVINDCGNGIILFAREP